jgi:hypothetical protein
MQNIDGYFRPCRPAGWFFQFEALGTRMSSWKVCATLLLSTQVSRVLGTQGENPMFDHRQWLQYVPAIFSFPRMYATHPVSPPPSTTIGYISRVLVVENPTPCPSHRMFVTENFLDYLLIKIMPGNTRYSLSCRIVK